ncbi:MAG: RNA methyltransferase [Armatimonadota bacterium]|nr:RNA methyltransferase [Armatimonadota bacterium]
MTKPQDYFVRHEFGSDRIPIEEARVAPRLPIYAVLDNIRSAHNAGSMFRTADGAGAQELLLCGYTPIPPHRHLSKTALGAVDVVPWRHCPTTDEAIEVVKSRGAQVLAVEYTESSVPLYNFPLRFPVAIVLGNEVAGLSAEIMAQCDATVRLPMHGLKSSLNVSVAFGIAVYEIVRRYGEQSARSLNSPAAREGRT